MPLISLALLKQHTKQICLGEWPPGLQPFPRILIKGRASQEGMGHQAVGGGGLFLEALHITPLLWSHSAVKVRLSRCNGSSFGLSDCNLDSGLEVLKAGPLPAVELAPILRRWLQLDATCMHNLLRGRHAETYVLSGEVQGHRLLVTTAYAWSQGHRNLQLAVCRWHHHQCPE